MYADDTTLFTSFSKQTISEIGIKNVEKLIEVELKKITDWLDLNHLQLNVKKTKYMIFHTRQQDISNINLHICIGNTLVERVSTFNFLGLNINNNMSWKDHTEKNSNRLSREVGILNKLKHYLPLYVMKMLYTSLIESHLNYCILAWGYESNRLFKLQKKAIRAITRSKYNAHTEPLFKQHRFLKVADLFSLNMLKFYYKYVHNDLPFYFQSYNITNRFYVHNRHTRNNTQFCVPVTRLRMSQKCTRNYIATLLNNTSPAILEKVYTHCYTGFINYAKSYKIDNYSNLCNTNNCYICQNS
jgi:hypothetical protein